MRTPRLGDVYKTGQRHSLGDQLMLTLIRHDEDEDRFLALWSDKLCFLIQRKNLETGIKETSFQLLVGFE